MSSKKNVPKSGTAILYDECHGCQNRQVGCHSHCKSYLASRKANDEANARKAAAHKTADDTMALQLRRKKRVAQFYKKK